MASYNTGARDPLLDSNLQAMIQRRGRELVGVLLLVLAGMIAVMLGSYAPSDPSWMSSSNVPVQNSLGRVGAAITSPLMVIIGNASWGLVLFCIGWGLRLITSRGHEQALARSIFLPIALAVTAIWCATLLPLESWDTRYGMGGVFGDTVLGAVINALPLTPAAGVSFMSVLLLCVMIIVWAFVLGVSLFEALRFGNFLLAGVVLTYAGFVAMLRGGLVGSAKGMTQGAGLLAERIQARRAARHARPAPDAWAPDTWQPAPEPTLRRAEPILAASPMPMDAQMKRDPAPVARPTTRPVIRAAGLGASDAAPRAQENFWREDVAEDEDDLYESLVAGSPQPQPEPQPQARSPMPAPQAMGLLSRLKALSTRPPSGFEAGAAPPLPGELVEPSISASALQAQPAGDARIKSRIADAIRNRKAAGPAPRIAQPRLTLSEPPLRAPQPAAHPHPQPHPAAQAPLRLDAHVSGADMAPVPMPDWMLAAQPALPPGAATADPGPQSETGRVGHFLSRRVVNTAPRRTQPSRQAQAEAEPGFQFEPPAQTFELPPLDLLEHPSTVERYTLSDEALEENARMLENVLEDYGVRGEIVSVRPGPVVTQYELEPAPGLKASRVIGLADDIARSMSALSARVSTVPGRSIIGIELPNVQREKVVLREILSARDFGDTNMRLPLALGKGIDGESIVANLAKMPHLLIAGTTGSGKSVAINTMILSLLYRLSPEECRMIMIDPKMLELSVYDGIPHLLSPVVTDPKKAVVALKWVVGEMEERYRKMSKMGVRNIDGFNGRVREALAKGEMFKRTIQTGFDDETGDPVFETEEFAPELLPFIVVVVDEMADLMMVAGKEIEACIQRLAQMARASGIHLIMATQRPSVDVITGTIKANFPTRISFQVTSKIDSRTILGEQGAEQLLGMGDMLYMAGGSRIVRVHGPFVSDEEVEEVVNHLKSFGPPDYKSGVVDGPESDREADIDAVLGLGGNTTGEDALYDQAVQVVIQDRKCSTSYIQRKLGIGYNKAARLVEQMEDEGLVTPANHVGKREILVPEQG